MTGSHINGRTAKGAQSPLGSDINKWIDSVRQYKEIMTMNDKEFRKLMKDINDAHNVLETYQEQVLSHASSIVSKIEKTNQNKDEEALESLRLIKDQLRQVQFADDKEFESEQIITRIDRITKNTIKGNNARIDKEWDKYFKLLEDYMNEKGHCYFEFHTIQPGHYLSRPKHFHIKFTTVDGHTLITQIYFSGDPFIETDPWASEAGNRVIPLIETESGLVSSGASPRVGARAHWLSRTSVDEVRERLSDRTSFTVERRPTSHALNTSVWSTHRALQPPVTVY